MKASRGLFILALATVSGVASAQFTVGNLVVAVVGDGGGTTGNMPVALRQYTTSGVQVGSDLSLNNVGGRNATVAWGETSEGALTLSGNKQFLIFGGYDLSVRNSGFNVLSSPRVITRVDALGNAMFSNTFVPTEGDGIRGVYSSDGDQFWATGGDLGIVRGTFAGPVTQHLSGVSSRMITMMNGLLYFNGSNAFAGSNGMATWDNVSATSVDLFGSPNGASGRDFEFVDENTLYYSTSSGGTGLAKMTFDGTNWNLAYTLSGTGLGHITVDPELTPFGRAIYATQSNGSTLLRTYDNGVSFSAWETLATATTNTRFRGVEMAPVPEPGTMAALGLGALALLRRRRQKQA